MYPFLRISILMAGICLSISPSIASPYPSHTSANHLFTNNLPSNPDSLALCILPGTMRYLRAILSEHCLPRNEASLDELNDGNISSDFFVPAQLGYWMMTAILSFEIREKYPDQTWGFEQQNLIDTLSCMMTSLEDILANQAFIDSLGTGKKALYQVHLITGEAPLNSGFDSTVSMLDNLYLVTALQFATHWADSVDSQLADRIKAILDEFDLSMWKVDGQKWRLGGPMGPRDTFSPFVNRIISESRLLFPVALARGEIDLGAMLCGIDLVRIQSKEGTSNDGTSVEYLPFFGTALEKWVPSVFFSRELATRLGVETLLPIISWSEEVRCDLSLPGNVVTSVGDGNGGFLRLSMSPSEGSYENHNLPILIPPAIMMEVGIAAYLHPSTACNFHNAFQVLADSNQLSSMWGPPNYLDFGTGLVNMEDPLRSTLEMAQGALALMNMLLGGNYVEDVLRRDTAWNSAIDQYLAALDHRLVIREAEEGAQGDGSLRGRSQACREKIWDLNFLHDTVCYEINIQADAEYEFQLRYSNDDNSVLGDSISVWLDGINKGMIAMMDTKDSATSSGGGWDIFQMSDSLELGILDTGPHELCLVLEHTDGFGVEIDAMVLRGDFMYTQSYSPPPSPCDCLSSSINDFDTPDINLIAYPNPFSSRTAFRINLNQPERISFQIININGQVVHSMTDQRLFAGEHLFEWDATGIPGGVYFLILYAEGYRNPIRKELVIFK